MRFCDEIHKILKQQFSLDFKQRNRQIAKYWESLNTNQQHFVLCDLMCVNQIFLDNQMKSLQRKRSETRN